MDGACSPVTALVIASLCATVIGMQQPTANVPSRMAAWLGTKGYEDSYPTPKPGELHKKFKDLPSECEVLVKVASDEYVDA